MSNPEQFSALIGLADLGPLSMDKQMIWNLINSLLGVAGVIGAFYAYTQVKLIRQANVRRENAARELAEWSFRAQTVVQKLVVLAPRMSHGGSGVAYGNVYQLVVPDPDLRGVIEGYLIHLLQSPIRAEARMLTPEMLQLKVVRDTIKRVEDCFDSVRKSSPVLASIASLDEAPPTVTL